MPLIINDFYDATKKTQWSWPLKIAVHTYRELFIQAMANEDHYSQFTHIHPVAKVQPNGRKERVSGTTARGKYDILFIIDDGKSNIASYKSVAANYIIVCQLKPADENYATYNKRHNGLIKYLLGTFNASGLVFFSIDRQPAAILGWYKNFIKSLTENVTISEALKVNIKDGYLIHIPSTAAEKPLEKGFSTVADRFKKLYDQNYSKFSMPKKDKEVRQRFDDVKSRIDSGARFNPSNKTQLASNLSQIHKQIDELNQIVKTKQVHARPDTPTFRTYKKIDHIAEIPSFKKDEIQNERLLEIVTVPIEKAQVAIVSDLEDLITEQPKPQRPTVQDPRYLQAAIFATSEPGTTLKQHLEPAKTYKLNVSISRLKEYLIAADESFPYEDILIDVRTPEEPIEVVFQPNNNTEAQSKTLLLPKLQDSPTVDFEFSTAEVDSQFNADILAYHKNRIIQIVHLNAPVNNLGDHKHGSNISLKTIFSSRKNLDGLGNRLDFGLALHYEEQDGQAVVTGVIEKKPVKFNTGGGLQGIVNHIKQTIEKAARDPEAYPHDIKDPNNQKLLVNLAISGTRLYNNLIQQKVTGDGPLQVVANRAVFVPFDFVYTLPAPKYDAVLCEHTREALVDGKCLGCLDKTIEPADHICPFGFWGFNRVIERFKYNSDKDNDQTSDLLVYSEPVTGRNTLNILRSTIHGSSDRVNVGDPDRRKKLAEFLHTKSSTSTVETWSEWEMQTAATEPETIVLITHIQRNAEFNLDEMEIGGDILAQTHFGSKHILEKQKPFAVVIGCEVDNINNQGFDISSDFLNKGAVIVITNFTKISGSEAATIVTRLIELLKAESKAEIHLGEVVLKLKQQLLAEGLIASLSLTVYGDADWLITTAPITQS